MRTFFCGNEGCKFVDFLPKGEKFYVACHLQTLKNNLPLAIRGNRPMKTVILEQELNCRFDNGENFKEGHGSVFAPTIHYRLGPFSSSTVQGLEKPHEKGRSLYPKVSGLGR